MIFDEINEYGKIKEQKNFITEGYIKPNSSKKDEAYASINARKKSSYSAIASNKSRITYVVLAIWLGYFGGHNFYSGHVGRAFAKLGLLVLTVVFFFLAFDILEQFGQNFFSYLMLPEMATRGYEKLEKVNIFFNLGYLILGVIGIWNIIEILTQKTDATGAEFYEISASNEVSSLKTKIEKLEALINETETKEG